MEMIHEIIKHDYLAVCLCLLAEIEINFMKLNFTRTIIIFLKPSCESHNPTFHKCAAMEEGIIEAATYRSS
jgi:hypothetical protein